MTLCDTHASAGCADGMSIKVDNSEQASAIEVEMKDATSDVPLKSSDAAAKPSDGKSDPSNEPVAAVRSKGVESTDDLKLEGHSKDKENLVDENLVRAFRYFDTSGKW